MAVGWDREQEHSTIAETLARTGWCVTPDYLSHEATSALRETAAARWQAEAFRPAGIGRQRSGQTDPSIRSDAIAWLDDREDSPALADALNRFENLRQSVNRECFLGLFDFEAHFARYDVGARYARHLDRFRDDSARTLSCVLYLNQHWNDDDGGHLRLHLDEGDAEFIDVIPAGGTLVTFLSARFAHEVLPARRERWSLAGWFRTRS